MTALAERAEPTGIVLLHENEKDIYGDVPDRVLDIVESGPTEPDPTPSELKSIGGPKFVIGSQSSTKKITSRPGLSARLLAAPLSEIKRSIDADGVDPEGVPAQNRSIHVVERKRQPRLDRRPRRRRDPPMRCPYRS